MLVVTLRLYVCLYFQGSLCVIRWFADEVTRRRQQLTRLWMWLPRLPAHEETCFLKIPFYLITVCT